MTLLPHQVPLILAVNAAIFIIYGRLKKRWSVAILGLVLLAVAGLLVLLGSANG